MIHDAMETLASLKQAGTVPATVPIDGEYIPREWLETVAAGKITKKGKRG